MESVIKWRTGEPEKDGEYLVTDEFGEICFAEWYNDSWEIYDDNEVIAWCPLNKIKPYKE